MAFAEERYGRLSGFVPESQDEPVRKGQTARPALVRPANPVDEPAVAESAIAAAGLGIWPRFKATARSVGQRSLAASSVFACGFSAPAYYVLAWGGSRVVPVLGRDDGTAFMGMIQPGDTALTSFFVGAVGGACCGVAMFANSIVEAPYQLVRRDGVLRYTPVLHRMIENG